MGAVASDAIENVSIPQITPHTGQQRLMRECKRFNVVCCGRRWGKTLFAQNLLLYHSTRGALYSNPVAWYAPTYKDLIPSWKSLRQMLLPITSKANDQEKRIELETGGVVEAWSLDAGVDVSRGRKYSLVVIDEAAIERQLSVKWQLAIRPTLTDMCGSAWFFSTPKGFNFFHDLFMRSTHPDYSDTWQSWQMPTSTNPHIPASELELLQRELPRNYYDQEYNAKFVSLSEQFFRQEYFKSVRPPSTSDMYITMAVDPAISKSKSAAYTAIVVAGRAGDEYFILDAKRFKGGLNDITHNMRSMYNQWRPALVGVEDVQFQRVIIEEMGGLMPIIGLNPKKYGGDKTSRALPLLALYEHGKVYHSDVLNIEFEQELLDFPHGEFLDQVDAAVYAVAMLQSAGSVQIG